MSYFIHNACGDSRRFGNLGIQNRKDLDRAGLPALTSFNRGYFLVLSEELEE